MNKELFEKYQKYEGYADFAKMVGIGIAIASTPILSVVGVGVGGLTYAVGCLYNRKFRHTRENMLKSELEKRLEEKNE